MYGSQNAKFIGLGLIPKPKPVDTTSAQVIRIAKFAVQKHNEDTGTKLVFIEVVGGVSWNVVAGTLCALIIAAQDTKGTYWDKAVIRDAMFGYKKLVWYRH